MLSLIFTLTPFRFLVQSFWRDEAFSYLLAKQDLVHICLTTAKDANPPLYYVLLHVWMLLFGSSEVAIRMVSFLFFLGTLYVVGLFLMEFFKTSPKRTLLYLALFAVNPLLHYYAFEGRMYSMFAFFSVLSFYYFQKKSYRNYLIATVLGLFTHYFMVFVLISQITYVLFRDRKLPQNIISLYLKMAAIFAPWLLVVLLSHPPVESKFWIPRLTLSAVFNLPGRIFTGYEDLIGFQYPLLPVVSLLLYVFFVYAFYRLRIVKDVRMHHVRHRFPYGLLFFWVMIPIVLILTLSIIKPVFLPRYTIFISVGLLFILISLLESLENKTRTICLIIAFVISLHYGTYQVLMRRKADIRTPLKEISRIMGKGDVVYVVDPYNFHPAEYYINDKVVYIYEQSYDKLPWYIGKILIPEDKVTSTLPTFPHKAFILNSDTGYVVQALY